MIDALTTVPSPSLSPRSRVPARQTGKLIAAATIACARLGDCLDAGLRGAVCVSSTCVSATVVRRPAHRVRLTRRGLVAHQCDACSRVRRATVLRTLTFVCRQRATSSWVQPSSSWSIPGSSWTSTRPATQFAGGGFGGNRGAPAAATSPASASSDDDDDDDDDSSAVNAGTSYRCVATTLDRA